MVIFKYELKQMRSYTIWWSAAALVLIIGMLPTYVSMLDSGAVNIEQLGQSGIFDFLGTDPTVITQPVGVFGFLTSFFAIAAGISGMFLGLSTFSKESVGRSSEFLYTKPFRRGQIFLSKLFVGLVVSLMIGVCYIMGSLIAAQGFSDIPMNAFILIALSFTLIELYFLLFGALVGAIQPKIRSPLLVSSGVVFMFYVFSAFASKMGIAVLKYFSPFSYFGASSIVKAGGYDIGYLSVFLLLCVIYAIGGYVTFIKKDVSFIS